jgi:hypothetical protein
MQKTPLLMAAAAFALTATGVYAHGNAKQIISRADLSEEQVQALEVAHELRQAGDIEAARDTLVEAGFDVEALKALREAKQAVRAEINAAIEAGDYEAFREAALGTRIGEAITSEKEFKKLVEAKELRQEGEFREARAIYQNLDLPRGKAHGHYH